MAQSSRHHRATTLDLRFAHRQPRSAPTPPRYERYSARRESADNVLRNRTDLYSKKTDRPSTTRSSAPPARQSPRSHQRSPSPPRTIEDRSDDRTAKLPNPFYLERKPCTDHRLQILQPNISVMYDLGEFFTVPDPSPESSVRLSPGVSAEYHASSRSDSNRIELAARAAHPERL